MEVLMYGFAETDAIVDSARSLAETAGNSAVDRNFVFAGANGRTQFSIRNSRLGFNVAAPKIDDWATKGVLEFDFFGPSGTTVPQCGRDYDSEAGSSIIRF